MPEGNEIYWFVFDWYCLAGFKSIFYVFYCLTSIWDLDWLICDFDCYILDVTAEAAEAADADAANVRRFYFP